MILRKPYKFLVKYFKLIHIVMFMIFGYFAYMLNNIYKFFSNYVKNGGFTYFEGLVNRYVPFYIFLIIVLIIVATIFIYYLMRKKEKPLLFYQILIGYSILLLVMLIYMYSVFSSIEETPYEPLMVVVNRDIALGFYIINFFYVGFTFIRGFGFDIKKFSFDQDKKEFEIEEGDNEEFEVSVDIDKEDINTRVKHEKRALIYYIQENSKFFTILLIIILAFVGYRIYYKIFVQNKVYKEDSYIIVGNLTYHINKSYILKNDKNSDIISSNHYYVVVDVNIKNVGNKITLNQENFRILVDDSYYYPEYDYYNYFSDLGNNLIYNKFIKKESEDNYLLVFQILNKNSGKIYLEILNNSNNYTFDRIKLEPIKEKKESHNIVQKEFNINGVNFEILDYDVLDKSVVYTYSECDMNNCIELTKTINSNLNEVILKLEMKNVDRIEENFIEDYFGIMYDGKNVSSKNIDFLGRNNNIIYLSIPKGTILSNNLILTIKTRNDEYYITLR